MLVIDEIDKKVFFTELGNLIMVHFAADKYVMFVNAGGDSSNETDSSVKFLADTYFEGGNVLRTNEHINDGGDYPFIYQSARVGNFYYRFNCLPPGYYYVDIHFTEIINTNGPKGMRVFNVFIQEEKVSQMKGNVYLWFIFFFHFLLLKLVNPGTDP